MSFYFPNVDPIYLYKRSGSETDPFIYLEEVRDIRHNSVILNEVPSFDDGVQIFDENNNEMTEVTHDTLDVNEYRVDYTTGVVHFNSGMNGKKVTIKYYGTGYVDIPTTRIKIPSSSDEPLETLQDVLDRAEEGLKIINQVGSLTFMGEYDPTFHYKKWNFVTYNNKTFVAIQDNVGISPENENYWRLVSSGVDVVGVYNPDKTYTIGDIVSDSNKKKLYVSKIVNNRNPLEDSDSWELIITLEDVINSIDNKISELEDLKNQLINNENIRENNEVRREQDFLNIKNSLEQLEEDILNKEQQRIANENERKSAEQARINNENQRELNEQQRESNEAARQMQENMRQQNMSNALNQIQNSINEVNDVLIEVQNLKDDTIDTQERINQTMEELNNLRFMGEYNPESQYQRLNIVYYNGSSYIALQNSIGKSVDDRGYWHPISLAGKDGTEIIIDGLRPNEAGEISLEPLGFIKEHDLVNLENKINDNIDLKIGDLSLLKTLRKNNIVEAINELKTKIDDIIDIIS